MVYIFEYIEWRECQRGWDGKQFEMCKRFEASNLRAYSHDFRLCFSERSLFNNQDQEVIYSAVKANSAHIADMHNSTENQDFL